MENNKAGEHTQGEIERIKFPLKLKDLDMICHNLESNGFEEYLNTWEKETVHGDEDMNHIVYTCLKGYYDGMVCDIYYNEKTGYAFFQYSGQRKDTIVREVISH